MSDPAAMRRQLKIKSRSVKQLLKDYGMYKTEVEQHQRSLDKYIADGRDEYDIKNQRNLLAESQKMIPDTQKRLASVVEALRDLVVAAKPVIPEDEDLFKAEEVLEEANL